MKIQHENNFVAINYDFLIYYELCVVAGCQSLTGSHGLNLCLFVGDLLQWAGSDDTSWWSHPCSDLPERPHQCTVPEHDRFDCCWHPNTTEPLWGIHTHMHMHMDTPDHKYPSWACKIFIRLETLQSDHYLEFRLIIGWKIFVLKSLVVYISARVIKNWHSLHILAAIHKW